MTSDAKIGSEGDPLTVTGIAQWQQRATSLSAHCELSADIAGLFCLMTNGPWLGETQSVGTRISLIAKAASLGRANHPRPRPRVSQPAGASVSPPTGRIERDGSSL